MKRSDTHKASQNITDVLTRNLLINLFLFLNKLDFRSKTDDNKSFDSIENRNALLSFNNFFLCEGISVGLTLQKKLYVSTKPSMHVRGLNMIQLKQANIGAG
jgi:hypothetical protein